MKHIKVFDKKYEIVEDNGKWQECPICDLCELCALLSIVTKEQLCDTPTDGIRYYHYHFREVKKED